MRWILRGAVGWVLIMAAVVQAAEYAGSDRIEQLRVFGTNHLILYASGVVTAMNTMGMICQYPPTAGELAAHLQYTAPAWKTESDALREEWARRGCTTKTRWGVQDTGQATWFDPLYQIRTTTDEGVLLQVVGLEGTDRTSLLMRMLATDRLRELGRTIRQTLPTQ